MATSMPPAKSFPAAAQGLDADAVGAQGWSVLTDFATPLCTLSEDALSRNLTAMQA